MKAGIQKLKNIQIIIASAVFFVLAAITVSSCRKDSLPNNSYFVGTFECTNSCDFNNKIYLTFLGGNTENTVTIAGTTGTGSCAADVVYTGTVSYDTIITFPETTYTDACGGHETFGGSGTFSGNTLNISFTSRDTLMAATTCVFTGAKQ